MRIDLLDRALAVLVANAVENAIEAGFDQQRCPVLTEIFGDGPKHVPVVYLSMIVGVSITLARSPDGTLLISGGESVWERPASEEEAEAMRVAIEIYNEIEMTGWRVHFH